MTPEEPTTEELPTEHPLVTIWESPRATIRRIVATDPRHWMNLLFFAGGVVGTLNSSLGVLGRGPLGPLVLVGACLAGGLASIPISHLGAWLTCWVGGLLGGVASRVEVAAVTAWSSVPSIVGGMGMFLARLALLGSALFGEDPSTTDPASPLVTTSLRLASLLLGAWSGVIAIVGFAEVNRFSIARAIGSYLLSTALVFLGVAVPVVVGLVLLR